MCLHVCKGFRDGSVMETKVSKETAHHCQMQGSDRRGLGAVTDFGI